MNRYKVGWIGTADIVSDTGEVLRRVPIGGVLVIEGVSGDEVRGYAEFGSDGLLDVDFIEPGGGYSASNPHVVGGSFEAPKVAAPDEWQFHHATITSITREVVTVKDVPMSLGIG